MNSLYFYLHYITTIKKVNHPLRSPLYNQTNPTQIRKKTSLFQPSLHCNKVMTFWLVTSVEQEVKDSRGSGIFQSCFQMSQSCFRISSRYLQVLWFILILIYNSGWKYWLQKYFTENIDGFWASSFKIRAKIETQEQLFSVCLTSQMSFQPMSCYMSCNMFLQSAFEFGYLS